MIDVRPFARLGAFQNDWLNTHHHFSFADYHDPARMGFGRLRVWNDDEIAAGTGFDPHSHRDMEIVTYVRTGAITHRDSLGNEGRTDAGNVQVMHAGTGIVHAEYNMARIPTTLFQIWILPDKRGMAPGWDTRRFPRLGGGLSVLASGRETDAASDTLHLYADAGLLAGTLAKGETVHVPLAAARGIYLVPASGSVSVNGVAVGTRDGVAVTGEPELAITANDDAEIVLVDVAA